jgi:hypothetical protein
VRIVDFNRVQEALRDMEALEANLRDMEANIWQNLPEDMLFKILACLPGRFFQIFESEECV